MLEACAQGRAVQVTCWVPGLKLHVAGLCRKPGHSFSRMQLMGTSASEKQQHATLHDLQGEQLHTGAHLQLGLDAALVSHVGGVHGTQQPDMGQLMQQQIALLAACWCLSQQVLSCLQQVVGQALSAGQMEEHLLQGKP